MNIYNYFLKDLFLRYYSLTTFFKIMNIITKKFILDILLKDHPESNNVAAPHYWWRDAVCVFIYINDFLLLIIVVCGYLYLFFFMSYFLILLNII